MPRGSPLEPSPSIAARASVRHLLGHLPPLGREILVALRRPTLPGLAVGLAHSLLVLLARRKLPLGYDRRRALQPPEAGVAQAGAPGPASAAPGVATSAGFRPGGCERPPDAHRPGFLPRPSHLAAEATLPLLIRDSAKPSPVAPLGDADKPEAVRDASGRQCLDGGPVGALAVEVLPPVGAVVGTGSREAPGR